MTVSPTLGSPVRYLKGVGPARERLLARIDVNTIGDLLLTFPRRYEDRRNLTPLRDLVPGSTCFVLAKVVDFQQRKARSRKLSISRVVITDGSTMAEAVWFNIRGLEKAMTPGKKIALYGRIEQKYGRLQIQSPDFEVIEEEDDLQEMGKIVPVYPSTAGIYQKWLRRTIRMALSLFLSEVHDILPEEIMECRDMPPVHEAIMAMHYPGDRKSWARSRKRLAYEEFFLLQTALALRKKSFGEGAGRAPQCTSHGDLAKRYLSDILTFELTGAQRKVISQIEKDMAGHVPMHRLVQGDVGSGKTVVAVYALLLAVDNGYQGLFMAPTEILAHQHFSRLKDHFEQIGIRSALLTGSMGSAEKREILEKTASGAIQILVGTHALFQDEVAYHDVGLVVVDEQHRFGVMQRNALKSKGEDPHMLVMTATPIPRTLTLSVYGDLAVSVMDEMPPGRQAVETKWIRPSNLSRLLGFLRKEVDQGRQVYWVCPLIEDSESIDSTPLNERYDFLKDVFTDLDIGILHGKLPQDEKDRNMAGFAVGEIQILVATTIVEVGVDVPNASIMVIEDATRFGLSQLHQLRGRVGRGRHRSFCILVAEPGNSDALERIRTMCSTNDGFRIAEVDLKLRGPGELCGLRQHGVTDFRVADLLRDRDLLYLAREDAFSLVERDPHLKGHPQLRERVYQDLGETLHLVETG
ncbi:MAG: ATP-dependent DNA helicase RecG [Synergistales bacterium]|nr:ATP-dependent DNA helicase RecG [Synergistales bacterium]